MWSSILGDQPPSVNNQKQKITSCLILSLKPLRTLFFLLKRRLLYKRISLKIRLYPGRQMVWLPMGVKIRKTKGHQRPLFSTIIKITRLSKQSTMLTMKNLFLWSSLLWISVRTRKLWRKWLVLIVASLSKLIPACLKLCLQEITQVILSKQASLCLIPMFQDLSNGLQTSQMMKIKFQNANLMVKMSHYL